MPDSGTLLVEAIIAVAAAAIALVVMAATVRGRTRWLAGAGVAMLLIAPAAALLQPAGSVWDGALNVAGYAIVFTVYPSGRFDSRWLALTLAAYSGLAVTLLFGGAALTLNPWWTVVALTEVLLVVVLVHRYRRRLSTDERERVRWGVLGATITFVGMPTLVAATALSGTSIAALGVGGALLSGLLVVAFPLSLAFGLILPRAAPVDIVLVIVLRVTIVAVPIAVVGALLLGTVPDDRGAWIAIVAVAIAVLPLYRCATWLADRFVYRRRLSPVAAVVALDQALGREHAPEDAPQVVAEVIRRALDATATAVRGQGLAAATVGEGHLTAIASQPVVYGGAQIAVIEVGSRPGESDLTRTDRQILAATAARAAAALHAARTVAALVEARSETVLAHEEERRRLRRDLHDDLAPTLVGLSLEASGLERMLRQSDRESAAAAGRIVTDIRSAIAQTRALAYGLQSPALDDGDLSAAIREGARSTDGLVIEVTGPHQPIVVPAAVEVTALRIVQEAVANVRRHSQARRCDVRIGFADGALTITVDDDGTGMPENPVRGLGLESMRDRATTIGGRIDIGRSELGGVRIDATLPVGAR